MMEKIQGTIEKKEFSEGKSEKGLWRRCVFTINGKKYSTFDTKIMDEFAVDEFVEMEGEQKDQYWNMKTMEKIEEPEIKHQKIDGKNPYEKDPVGLAVEIFCELMKFQPIVEKQEIDEYNHEKVMEKSIELVKQAKEAFE